MTLDWPEGIDEFEVFLRSRGLSFQFRGRVPDSHDIIWQYGTDKIGVRVIADRGLVWSAQIADIAGWPQQWYVAAELQELVRSAGNSPPNDNSVAAQMRIIEENWSAIVDAFAPQNREKTHTLLKGIRSERSKKWFSMISQRP